MAFFGSELVNYFSPEAWQERPHIYKIFNMHLLFIRAVYASSIFSNVTKSLGLVFQVHNTVFFILSVKNSFWEELKSLFINK